MNECESIRENGFFTIESLVEAGVCEAIIDGLPEVKSAGSRNLLRNQRYRELSETVRVKLLPNLPELNGRKALQCSLFDKSEKNNWLVPWHQERSMPVSAQNMFATKVGNRIKGGIEFTQPGVSVLEGILAVRLHLDRNTPNNGPLKVLPRTHKLGILCINEIAKLSREHSVTITGAVGSAMVMRPLLVHASSKILKAEPRRVLHFLYA